MGIAVTDYCIVVRPQQCSALLCSSLLSVEQAGVSLSPIILHALSATMITSGLLHMHHLACVFYGNVYRLSSSFFSLSCKQWESVCAITESWSFLSGTLAKLAHSARLWSTLITERTVLRESTEFNHVSQISVSNTFPCYFSFPFPNK